MNSASLGRTGLSVSAIGLGCVGLTAIPRQSDALTLLEAAYDLGISHFDTARAYGAGFSEEILGRFAKGKRDQITISTKFGILPPPMVVGNRQFVSAVKEGLRHIPILDRAVRRRLAAGAAVPKLFTPDACRTSLEKSLSTLNTEYVDFFFLHNGTRSDAEQDDLIETATRLREAGKIRAFGISSPIAYVGESLDDFPSIYSVFQGDHGVVGGGHWKNRGLRGIIAFATLGQLRPLIEALSKYPARRDAWSITLDADLLDKQLIASLLIQAALDANRDGGLLVGTRNIDHLATAVAAISATTSADTLAAFRVMCVEMLSGHSA